MRERSATPVQSAVSGDRAETTKCFVFGGNRTEDKAPRLVDRAVLFIDKGRDSGEVVKLVERLRDALTRYQVSED